jgi:protease secretion system outer membrane protein
MKISTALGLLLVGLLIDAPLTLAQTYPEALAAARRNDSIYATRLAEVQDSRLQARQARFSYLPSIGVSYGESNIGNSARTAGVSVSQPLLDYDKFLAMQEARPLEQKAEQNARLADFDLQQRVLRTMGEIIRNRETIRALEVQVQSLETQTQRAKRMRQVGQGTVTEISDFEVRLAIARANRLTVANNLRSAERAFTLITGIEAIVPSVDISSMIPKGQIEPVETYISRARANNPSLEQSRLDIELEELTLKRSRAEWWPTITAYASYAKTEGLPGEAKDRIGIALSMPLNSKYILNGSRAAIQLKRARESARYSNELLESETRRLHATVLSLRNELAIREQAIENAKLAVEGNLKGYQGGIRSNIDVVTSIQNLADAEVALVNSRVSLATSYLDLELLRAEVR